MFEWLFNYPIDLWQQARLVFDGSLPLWSLLLAVGLALLLIAASLWRRRIRRSRRLIIAGWQSMVALVILLMLWQPALRVSVTERGENTVAWVLDTSRSMELEDASTDIQATNMIQRRAAGVSVLERLAVNEDRTFSASLYGLGEQLEPVPELGALLKQPAAARSNIRGGLDDLLKTINESALAAVVLLSDGADNSDHIDSQWWQTLAAAGVPVHTVGIGRSHFPADLELRDVSLPEQAQPGSQIVARLRISHSQAGTVRVRVMSGDELLAAEDINVPAGVQHSMHSLNFVVGQSGIHQLEFSLEPMLTDDNGQVFSDPIVANNRQARILQVENSPKRVLYVEGEPRWEYKFLRRALDDHPGVEVASLLRTSPNKFYRQGVKNGNELLSGFPDSREQLFLYDAVIIGSFAAAELSTAQQSALRDFVSERGGALLMLGGREGLADGGWGRSVVASALPVQLGSRLSSDTFSRQRHRAWPTLSGLRTPWLQLADNEQANREAWLGLPDLADAQSVGQLKPGAITLLERVASDSDARLSEPLLVMQRYGRGQSLVLGTSGTWRWQMSLPSDDMRHERFWRQLLGMLVEQSLPRLSLEADKPLYRDADHAQLSVLAYAADYTALQQSSLPVTLNRPDGTALSLSLYPDSEHAGRYTGVAPMDSEGPYSLVAVSALEGEAPRNPPASAQQWWLNEADSAEDFNAGLQAGFLQRISETTGGSYLPLSDVERLVDVLATENVALKRENHLPLWNMPFFFLCLIFFKLIEWGLRLRWKRL